MTAHVIDGETVEHEQTNKGPASMLFVDRIDRDLAANGVDWQHFHTEHADAWVLWVPGAPVYLVHDVASRQRGHGTLVMRAVGEWADELRIQGHLVCTAELTAFYEVTGWQIGGWWAGHAEMYRLAQGQTCPIVWGE